MEVRLREQSCFFSLGICKKSCLSSEYLEYKLVYVDILLFSE